jgi:hypothetical protein
MTAESEEMVYGGVEYNSMHSLLLYYVELTMRRLGLHTLASLSPRTSSWLDGPHSQYGHDEVEKNLCTQWESDVDSPAAKHRV